MQPLMYSTVSEMPSSPCPPISPASTSTQLKEVGASLTGRSLHRLADHCLGCSFEWPLFLIGLAHVGVDWSIAKVIVPIK